MKRNRGFTLVELLVVLAIISILATIVVPNVATYLRKAQATRAVSEITNMETALTKMIGDANRTELGQILNPSKVVETLAAVYQNRGLGLGAGPPGFEGVPRTAEQFNIAVDVYTNVFYALLRDGRGLLDGSATDPEFGFAYSDLLDQNAVRRMSIGYLDIGFDPWDNLYKIYPGPWPSREKPIPFRIFNQGTSGNLPGRASGGDILSVNYVDPDTNDTFLVGYPAPRSGSVFIWSLGANTISGQVLYDGAGYDIPNRAPETYYDQTQDPEFIAGGDDINNWDPSRSWERFYN